MSLVLSNTTRCMNLIQRVVFDVRKLLQPPIAFWIYLDPFLSNEPEKMYPVPRHPIFYPARDANRQRHQTRLPRVMMSMAAPAAIQLYPNLLPTGNSYVKCT